MISEREIILRLLLGAVLGGIIGFERQSHGRPAGFRTHLLVCLASVLFMVVSEYYHYLSQINPSYIRIDPARIAQGAITGVGFIGAGVILKTGFTIQGLTTAACIWVVSAIGIAIGTGLYMAGIVAGGITFFTLWFLRRLERAMPSLSFRHIAISGDIGLDDTDFISVFEKRNISIERVGYKLDIQRNESQYDMTISYKGQIEQKALLKDLASIKRIKSVSIKD